MRPQGSPAELERRRLRAITLLEQGLRPVIVAQMVGVDRRSVRRWKRAARFTRCCPIQNPADVPVTRFRCTGCGIRRVLDIGTPHGRMFVRKC